MLPQNRPLGGLDCFRLGSFEKWETWGNREQLPVVKGTHFAREISVWEGLPLTVLRGGAASKERWVPDGRNPNLQSNPPLCAALSPVTSHSWLPHPNISICSCR